MTALCVSDSWRDMILAVIRTEGGFLPSAEDRIFG